MHMEQPIATNLTTKTHKYREAVYKLVCAYVCLYHYCVHVCTVEAFIKEMMLKGPKTCLCEIQHQISNSTTALHVNNNNLIIPVTFKMAHRNTPLI